MDQELVYIINLYQSHCYHMVKRIFNHLGIRSDLIINNFDWARLQIEESGMTICGIKYRKHGCGLTMSDNNIEVNFDFGSKGQLDGFDEWKIWEFIDKNKINCSYQLFDDIFNEFAKAKNEGILEPSESLFYFLSSKV